MVQQGYTPLIVASTLGDVELVELLLEAGATLEVCDPVSDGSPMMDVTIPSLLVLITHTIITVVHRMVFRRCWRRRVQARWMCCSCSWSAGPPSTTATR